MLRAEHARPLATLLLMKKLTIQGIGDMSPRGMPALQGWCDLAGPRAASVFASSRGLQYKIRAGTTDGEG